MNSAVAESPPLVTRSRALTAAALLLFAALGLLWFILCRQLSYEWSANEQYNYGWFVPFFTAFLFWLRWGSRPEPVPPPPTAQWKVAAWSVLPSIVAIAFVRLFEPANPDWRPLDWLHALAAIAMTLFVIWCIGGKPWLRHFLFPLLFFLVAVPWISPIETPIVQGLMRLVAAAAAETAQLLGIPAQLSGSLIRINRDLLGVEEACSGVRSLQTAIMIGLLFGELKRLSTAQRCLLLFCCLAIALIANFGRTILLVWIAATRGIDQISRWHDLAGYSIIGLVFVVSLGAAEALGRRATRTHPAAIPSPGRARGSISVRLLGILLVALCVIEAGVEVWYRAQQDLAARRYWEIAWPHGEVAYREPNISERVHEILRFDQGRQAIWVGDSDGRGAEMNRAVTFFLFAFHWEAHSPNWLLARSHRPDICLPNSGWEMQADLGTRSYQSESGIVLPFRHSRFALTDPNKSRRLIADAFFCTGEDWVRLQDIENAQFYLQAEKPTKWSFIKDRFHAVRHGLRNSGTSVVEVILVSPDQVDGKVAEEEFVKLFRRLVRPTSSSQSTQEPANALKSG